MMKPLSAYYFISKYDGFQKETACLARFNLLFDTVTKFLQSGTPALTQKVMLIRNDSAYLLNIFAKFNI